MATLLQALYTYAYENRMAYSAEDKRKCSKSISIAEQAQSEIMEMLPKEGQLRFEDYIREESFLQTLELENIFRAGLAIGLEISHLQ